MPPKFRTRSTFHGVAETAERLFDDLPREQGAPEAPWAHQADLLRAYHADHLNSSDVALELPTGAGKTLPGLLIAEWRRRRFGHRVAYACPTQQLAQQSATAAGRLGISVVTLVGSHTTWDTSEKMSYEAARTIAITTYSSIFNARPAVEPAGTLILDDAHAAEGFVASAWSVAVSRFEDEPIFRRLLEAVRPALSGVAFDLLASDDDSARRGVQMVGVRQVRVCAQNILGCFADLTREDDLYWRVDAIRERLDRCQVYVAWDGVLIRPFIPPTASHRHFTDPEQRIYLSATLGEGGELERAFGRTPIARLRVPDGWDSRGAGRRFFVFPDLQRHSSPREIAAAVVSEAGKALVLAPSARAAAAAADLAPAGSPVLGPLGAADRLLEQFRSSHTGLLTLANRYDGLDLPDAQCRVTVLDGLPKGANLQERFLSDTLLAGRVLRERLRTRVVQGAGRCTRGISDHSVVVVLGDDITRFIALPEVHNALRPEMQAELDFGLENSTAPLPELLDFVRSFLSQDRDWREQAEPDLLDRRKAAVRTDGPEAGELALAARHEIRASAAIWSGDWLTASAAALDAAHSVASPKLTGYRALWTYFAAAWLAEQADSVGDDVLRRGAADLLRKAYAAGRGTGWLRQVEPLRLAEPVLDPADRTAVESATEGGPRHLSPSKWATQSAAIITGLGQADAPAFERALVGLGKLLGAESYKPAGDGRTDSAWIWDSQWWLALEAKTEETPDAPVSLATVRQANDQLKTLSHDRDEPTPQGSAVVIITPRELVDPTAAIIAEDFVYATSPSTMREVASDAIRAWRTIRAQGSGIQDSDVKQLVARVFAEYRVLPSDLSTRLLQSPVHG